MIQTIVLLFILPLIAFLIQRNKKTREARNILPLVPCPPYNPIIGHFGNIPKHGGLVNTLKYFFSTHGDFFLFLGFGPEIVVSDPHELRKILNNSIDRGEGFNIILREVSGVNGIFTQYPDQSYRRHRKIVAPIFTKKCLGNVLWTISEPLNTLIVKWENKLNGSSNKKIAICSRQEFKSLALDIIGKAALGYDFGALSGTQSKFLSSIECMLKTMNERLQSILPRWIYKLPFAQWKLYRAQNVIFNEIVKIIENKNSSRVNGRTSDKFDFLDILIGSDLDCTEITAEILTFLIAGYETVSTTMVLLFNAIGLYHDVQLKIRSEFRNTVVNPRLPSIDEIERLKYTEMVVNEVLRLTPAAYLNTRVISTPTRIGDYEVPSNVVVMYCPYILHHNPKYWSEPEKFIPERFANPAKIIPFSFIPFGGGPRGCIGKSFALAELKCAVGILCHRFRFDSTCYKSIETEEHFTLVPKGNAEIDVESDCY